MRTEEEIQKQLTRHLLFQERCSLAEDTEGLLEEDGYVKSLKWVLGE